MSPARAGFEDGDPSDIGRFHLLGRLGAGGMGVVYLGERADGVRAAVKVIRSPLGDDAAFVSRFSREINAARRVHSDFTASVIDADVASNQPWVAFSYIEGPTVQDLVAQGVPRMSVCVGIVAGVAEALKAIHAAGVIHRDLKPSNVLLPPTGVKVIDFGIASAVDATAMTTIGHVVGTPGWLAPEQVTGKSLTPAVDVFAWGMLTAYVTTGHHPFEGPDQSPVAVAYRITHQEPNLTGIPEALAPLVGRALAKDPGTRPSVDELIAAALPMRGPDDTRRLVGGPSEYDTLTLTTHLEAAPVAAVPGLARGRRRFAIAAAAVLALVLGAIGVFAALRSDRNGPKSLSTTTGTTLPTPGSFTATTVVGGRQILAPATTPPAVGECSAQLTFAVDGNINPLTCPNGAVNVLAWQYLAQGGSTVMALGQNATPNQVLAAACAERAQHGTIPIEMSVVDISSAYYGWRFPFDPGAQLVDGCPNQQQASGAAWSVHTDPTTGFTITTPPSWNTSVNGEQTIFKDPASGAYMLVEHREPAGPSALAAWQQLEPSFADQHPGYHRISMSGNDAAATWEYTYLDNGQTVHAIDYGFIIGSGRYGFALNWQANETDWLSLQPTFDQMRASFTNPPGT